VSAGNVSQATQQLREAREFAEKEKALLATKPWTLIEVEV
jgi:hypothetical protein